MKKKKQSQVKVCFVSSVLIFCAQEKKANQKCKHNNNHKKQNGTNKGQLVKLYLN